MYYCNVQKEHLWLTIVCLLGMLVHMIWHVTHISFFDHSCRLPQTPDWSSTLSVMSPLSLTTITHQCWVPTGTLLVSAVCLASHVTSGMWLYRAHGRFIAHLTCCALWCNYIHVLAFMHSVFIVIPHNDTLISRYSMYLCLYPRIQYSLP